MEVWVSGDLIFMEGEIGFFWCSFFLVVVIMLFFRELEGIRIYIDL